jgi:aminopeptidase N
MGFRLPSAILFLLLSAVPCFGQRLPGNVVPVHYDIRVEPNLAAATFAGSVSIRVALARPAAAIVLNAAEIEFDGVAVTSAGRTQPATVSLDGAKEQATLTVPRALPAGPATIEVKYRGTLNDQLRGFYLSRANNRRYAVTQLEATDARRMFPSFDEPAFKATFSLTATIDAGDQAISNGAVLSDTPGPGAGKHTLTFDTTPKMSTYLVALAVGDFDCSAATVDGTPIRVCATPDKKGQTGFALDVAGDILRYFNQYYAIKYPFKKLDIVAVPDFAAGAMENTAAIFYRETLLLADRRSASVKLRKDIANVLAHEIAHQWFGNVVTMQWWDDIWLNEGFATWMASKPVKALRPEWNIELDEVLANQEAMTLDSLRSTRAIRSDASTPAQILELFDAIAYEKGAAVLRMIEAWVGEEEFRTGVNAYIERFKYGNARAEDFWSTLAKSTGKPVDRVMKGFVDQPGVPLVEAALRCAASRGTATLEQDRDAGAGAAGPAWNIPVCVKTPAGKGTCEVLGAAPAALPLESCPAWVMANAGARGYYRAVYPPEMLRSLAADVMALTPAERMGLLADEWALVRAGRHDVDAFMDLAAGFEGERTAAVVSTLTGALVTIGDDLTGAGSRGPYRAWLSALLRPAMQQAGWSPSTGATLLATLGEAARDPEAIAKAREIVLRELATPGTAEPTLLDAAVTVAARSGDARLYDRYLARTRTASHADDLRRFMYGLTSFSDPALVRRTMDYILGPAVRSQDAAGLVAALLENPDARDLAWQILQTTWDDLRKKTGGFAGYSSTVSALSSFCDRRTLGEVTRFFGARTLPEAERTLAQATERIRACADLAAAQADKLSQWLSARQP